MLRPSILVLLSLTPLLALAEDDPFADVVIEATELGDRAWMLTGRGGNMLLVAGDGGALLVDDQFAPLTDRITVKAAELADQPIRWVVNTHWHGDHTGGNENLGNAGAIIVAHEGVAERLSTEQFLALWNKKVPPAPMAARPQVSFTESVTLHLAGRPVTATYVGADAHTDGDSFVRVEDADVLHLGDVFFHGLYPFIDTGSGGNLDGMIAAAQKGLAAAGPDTKIVPGHGPLATKADLEAYVAMFEGVRDAIRPLVEQGLTREQIIAKKPTKPWDEAWGGGFLTPDDFVGIVVDGMMGS